MSALVRPRGRPAGQTGEELLAVARGVFLEKGYAAASMDRVAARAGISKASLYREHPSKASLYAAVVQDWVMRGRDFMRPALERLIASTDTRRGLVELAETMRAGILSAPVLQMRRLVTSEASTQPEVATAYLTDSWKVNIDKLADALRYLAAQDQLRLSDSRLAAEQLTWLVIGAPLNARLLTDRSELFDFPSPADAVDLFLAGYGPPPQPPPGTPGASRHSAPDDAEAPDTGPDSPSPA